MRACRLSVDSPSFHQSAHRPSPRAQQCRPSPGSSTRTISGRSVDGKSAYRELGQSVASCRLRSPRGARKIVARNQGPGPSGGQRAAIPQPREPPLRCLEITQSEIPLPRLPDRNESRTSPSADGPTDTSALPPSRFSPPRICNWQGAISCGSAVRFCCRGAA